MGDHCPECGGDTEFVERTARVVQGTCAGCGHTFTIVRGVAAVAGETPADAAAEAGGGRDEGAPSPTPGPSCGVCGAELLVRASSETTLAARCGSCETEFTYVLATGPGARATERFGGPARGPRDEGRRAGPPRGRPCRECGGPLRFSTDEEGNVTGECGSCGNRFTLRRRREDAGEGGERRFRAGGGRRFAPTYRRPGPWPRTAQGDRPRRFDRERPPYRRRDRRAGSEDDDDGEDRRRRRPRRD